MVGAFTRKIGYSDNTTAEIWSLREGLQLAQQLNLHNNLLVDTDSKVAIHLIENCLNTSHPNNVLLSDCRWLMRTLGVQVINHVPREVNSCADALAKASHKQTQNICLLVDNVPSWLLTPMLANIYGVAFPRLVSSSSSLNMYHNNSSNYLVNHQGNLHYTTPDAVDTHVNTFVAGNTSAFDPDTFVFRRVTNIGTSAQTM